MANSSEITVLWLPEWYPGRTHASNGDFIERHARAASQLAKVVVLYVGKDEGLPWSRVETEKELVSPHLTVYRAWYGKIAAKGVLERWWSLFRFRTLQRKMYRRIAEEQGNIDLVHVQVALKAGMLALHLRKKMIPYLVTEQWTGYYPGSKVYIKKASWLLRRLNRKIIQHASLLMPVSARQGELISSTIVRVNYATIDNVVDTAIFNYRPSPVSPFRFVHASYLNFNKNPEGMIRAAAALARQGYQFELVLIGNEDRELKQLAEELGVLDTHVFIKPFLAHELLAGELQRSSALIMFSRFENQPCIVNEALCCGLPVIATRVGGLDEVIDDKNGILVASEDEAALAKAMIGMMNDYEKYDRGSIATLAAARFNISRIAAEHLRYYRNVLEKNSHRRY